MPLSGRVPVVGDGGHQGEALQSIAWGVAPRKKNEKKIAFFIFFS